MRQKIWLALILICFLPLFTGCWNYQDIEDMDIALGVAIDQKQADGDYTLTIELVNQKEAAAGGKSGGQKDKKSESIVIEADGRTLIDAMRNAILKNGKKIFWGHCKGLIISRDIARAGIIPVMDMMWRDAETRPDIWVMVSGAESAGAIIKAETESGELVSAYLDSTVTEVRYVSKFIPDQMVKFISDLSVKTTSVVTPAVYTLTKEDKTLAEIKGSAVFKKDKLVYFLDEDESKTALLIRNELKGGIWAIDETGPQGKTRVALEIFKSKTKVTPLLRDGALVMNIKAEIEIGIAELEGSENYITRDKREILEKDLEARLTAKINELVQKTQNNYASDIFGFGVKVKQKMPEYWKKNQANWDYLYQKLEVVPEIKIDLTLSASAMKALQIAD